MSNIGDLILERLLAEHADQLQAVPSSAAMPHNTVGPAGSTTSTSDEAGTADHREQLAILVASGKTKEFIGSRLTQGDVKKLSERDVEKYYRRYEAALASRVTESIVDGFLQVASKSVGMAVNIDDAKKLHDDLKSDYIIQQELTGAAGLLSLRCGKLMALASSMLHIANHVVVGDGSPQPPWVAPKVSAQKPPKHLRNERSN